MFDFDLEKIVDFIEDLADIAKDISELPGKITEAAIETSNDINEIISQDIKNKIDGNPDKPIRTSYDIRDEAKDIIERVGKELSEAREELISAWSKMSKKAADVTVEREKVYSLIGKEIHSQKMAPLPPSSKISIYYPQQPSIDTLHFGAGTLLGAGGTNIRMNAAEQYLDAAKEYKIKVKTEISRLNSLKRSAVAVKSAYVEELKMLNIIRNSYTTRSESDLIQCADLLQNLAHSCLEEVSEHTDEKHREVVNTLKKMWC